MAAHPSSGDFSGSTVAVPRLNKDPVQSLRPYPVQLTISGQDFEIPALPAADWLSVLMADDLDLSDIFPGMVEGPEAIEDLILAGKVGLEEMEELILGIIDVVSARPWWVALRLIEQARVSWDVLGAELGLRGVDAAQVSLSSWLDMLLLVTLRSMDPKDTQMFCLKLEDPPPTRKTENPEPEISAAQFMTMAN